MLGLTNNPQEYEKALYCPEGRNKARLISVNIVSERERHYSNLMQTLTTTEGSTILKTSSRYFYKVGQEISYRGEWWIIKNVKEYSEELNPVAMRLTNETQGKRWAIELLNISIAPVAALQYNGNGNTSGTSPESLTAAVGSKITLSNGTGLIKGSTAITAWNSKVDGTGTQFALGGDFVMVNYVLFAEY